MPDLGYRWAREVGVIQSELQYRYHIWVLGVAGVGCGCPRGGGRGRLEVGIDRATEWERRRAGGRRGGFL